MPELVWTRSFVLSARTTPNKFRNLMPRLLFSSTSWRSAQPSHRAHARGTAREPKRSRRRSTRRKAAILGRCPHTHSTRSLPTSTPSPLVFPSTVQLSLLTASPPLRLPQWNRPPVHRSRSSSAARAPAARGLSSQWRTSGTPRRACGKRGVYIPSLSVCAETLRPGRRRYIGCSRSAFGNNYSAAFCDERLAATVHAKVPPVPRAPLELTQQTPISPVHVPTIKAAGASFIAEAGRLFKHWWPKYRTSIERCYLYQRADVPLPAAGVHAIMLRSPRAHVWSQHHRCHPATDRAEFARWVRQPWSDPYDNPRNSSCMPSCSQGTCIYDPRNLQARTLTCHRISSHNSARAD